MPGRTTSVSDRPGAIGRRCVCGPSLTLGVLFGRLERMVKPWEHGFAASGHSAQTPSSVNSR